MIQEKTFKVAVCNICQTAMFAHEVPNDWVVVAPPAGDWHLCGGCKLVVARALWPSGLRTDCDFLDGCPTRREHDVDCPCYDGLDDPYE